MRRALGLIPLFLLLSLFGSTRRYVADPVIAHPIAISAERLTAPIFSTAPELRYVDGWTLTSTDKAFGGFSGLAIVGREFFALSDFGLLARFSITKSGEFVGASINPLPAGCARDADKHDRDSESIVVDPATGASWIGFEWRNAICRSAPGMVKAQRVVHPGAMRFWSLTGGPEAIVRLADGRFLVFAEASTTTGGLPPLLVFDRDPTSIAAKVQIRAYQPPEHYFSPTDAVQLPDGRVLVLNRRFEPPFDFSARLSVIDQVPIRPTGVIGSRVIARFQRPGIADNFEGLAVSNENGRTYVWIMSDNNFLWIQHSYLLKFELLPERTDAGR